MVVKQFSNGIHQEIGNEDTFDVIPGKDMALKLNNVTDTDATRFRCTFLSSFAAPKSIIEVETEGEFLPFIDSLCGILLTLLPGGGGGGTQKSFIRGGSVPRSNPLPFYIPFFQKRHPFRIPFIGKRHPFHIPS